MSFTSLLALIYQNMATTSRIEVKFTATQLEAIRATAYLEATNKISTSDALAGYLVTVLIRISSVTIENITNIISVGLCICYSQLTSILICSQTIEESNPLQVTNTLRHLSLLQAT
jgi:hypothetical protein